MKLSKLPVLLGLCGLVSCGWDVMPPDDAGDAAWVMQVVPTLLGRGVKNTDELRVLVAMVERDGREVVVNRLMSHDDFVTYWSLVILDGLELSTDDTSWDAIDPDCLYPGIHSGPLAPEHMLPMDQATAQELRDRVLDPANATQNLASPGSLANITFTDLLRAAVVTDSMDMVYPAYLPVMISSNRTKSGAVPEGDARESTATRFMQTYLGRDPMCIGCHTTEYSVSGGSHPARPLDRHVPMQAPTPDGYANVEQSLFSWNDADGDWHDGAYFPAASKKHIKDFFHTQTHPQASTYSTLSPWALRPTCLERANAGGPSWPMKVNPATNGIEPVFAGLQPTELSPTVPTELNALHLGALLLDGSADLATAPTESVTYEPPPLSSAALAEIDDAVGDRLAYDAAYLAAHDLELDYDEAYALAQAESGDQYTAEETAAYVDGHALTTCLTGGCHSGSSGHVDENGTPSTAFLAKVSDAKLTDVLMTGSGDMPALCDTPTSGLSTEDCVATTIRWLREQSGVDPVWGNTVPLAWDPPDRFVDPEAAYAYLVAQQFVNLVFEEVAGEPLVLQHGFPRHMDQADVLGTLTETFVTEGWSLRALLEEMVLSKGFNRGDIADNPGDPWVVPPLTNPLELDLTATTGEGRFNSQGDLVHRLSVDQLAQKVHHALGWPSRWNLTREADYPTEAQLWDVGAWQSPEKPAFEEVTLGTLLAWEQTFGSCVKPVEIQRIPGDPWFDGPGSGTVLTDPDWDDWIDVMVAQGVPSGISRYDALALIKERLIGDPDIGPETQLLDAWWAPMNAGLLSDPLDADDEDALREFCSAVLTSPQFLLGGLPSANDPASALTIPLPARPVFRDEPVGPTGFCAEPYQGVWDGVDCVIPLPTVPAPEELY